MVNKNKSLFIAQCVLLVIIFLSCFEFIFNGFHLFELLNQDQSFSTKVYINSIKYIPIVLSVALFVIVIISAFKIAYNKNIKLTKILNIILLIFIFALMIYMLVSFVQLFTSLDKYYQLDSYLGNSIYSISKDYYFVTACYELCLEFQLTLIVDILIIFTYGILVFVEQILGNNRKPLFAMLCGVCLIVSFVFWGAFGMLTKSNADISLSYDYGYVITDHSSNYKPQITYRFVNLTEQELTNLEVTYTYKLNGEEISNTYTNDSFPALARVELFECDYEGFEFVSIVVNCDQYSNLTLAQNYTLNSKSKPMLGLAIPSSALALTFGILYYTPLSKRKIDNTELLENPV